MNPTDVLSGAARWAVELGDCRTLLRELPDNCIDAVCTDPPYELGMMNRSWDKRGVAFDPATWREVLRVMKPGAHLLAFGHTRTSHRMVCAIEDAGFEIRDSTVHWLHGEGFPKSLDVSKALDAAAGASPEHWASWLRERRTALGLTEEALAEAVGCTPASVRDWEHGRARARGRAVEHILPSLEYRQRLGDLLGYPSAAERAIVAQAAQRAGDGTVLGLGHSGAIRDGAPLTEAAEQWSGWGTGAKPSHEPICLARRPLDGTVAENVLRWGVGALNIDGCRLRTAEVLTGGAGKLWSHYRDGTEDRAAPRVNHGAGRHPPNCVFTHHPDCRRIGTREVASDGHYPAERGKGGVGTAGHGGQTGLTERHTSGELAPEYECAPGCPVAALAEQSGERPSGIAVTRHGGGRRIFNSPNRDAEPPPDTGYLDAGTAARFYPQFEWTDNDWWPFYYCAKASRAERDKGCEALPPDPETGRLNNHISVKPVELCRWLVRLVTPPNGIVLDPFAGSASVGVACKHEQFRYIGMELEERSHLIAVARMRHTDSPMADWFTELCQ